ncbi:LysR family transcriptional regulator [Aquipuribacter hungaricus]|uniref:LysR family transcriptional regulator n=1 Tax=Aquipuribacter hungaricus TaxID=545624 RepID=A0ABV7WH10_9MICO
MTLDPRRLLVLRAVHRHGGVLAAAERLGLTPSAVSQHLARLEAETGLALVDRSRLGGGRSLALTAVGQAVSAHADDLAAALEAAEQTVSTLRGAAAGPVVVGAFPTALRRLVAPAVAGLLTSHPAVRPRVVEASDPAATHDLAAGRLDVAVLERDGDAPVGSTPGVVVRPLLRDPYRVVVPTSWPARTTAEVLSGPWVAGPPGSTARAALDRLVGGRGPAVAHVCLEYPAVLALVGAGLGAALVPDLALDQLRHPDVRTHGAPGAPPVQGSAHDDAIATPGTAGTTGAGLTDGLDAGARVLTVAHREGRHEPTAAAEVVLAALRRQAARPGGA